MRPIVAVLAFFGPAVLVASVWPAPADPARGTRTLVVVVNRQRPETDVPLHTLSRIIRGEQRFWDNGDLVHPVLPPDDQPEARASFLSTVVKLDQRGFALHWRNLIFRGDVTDQPISPPDERQAVRSVFAERGGIAVVEGSTTKNLALVAKILNVNGLDRTAAGYPLKW